VKCQVSDNGSLSSTEVRPGSGLRTIEALARPLGASVQFEIAENGTEATLLGPIKQGRCDGLALTRQGAASLTYGNG
jgi:hypothetical protein